MSETSRPVTLQQIANRGSLYYRLVWTEEGATREQVFQTEEEAVVEMSAIEERLRAAAMGGQGFTVNPFGELKPFVNSRDVHYASLKLRPRGLAFREVIDDFVAAHTALKPFAMRPLDAAKAQAEALALLQPFDVTPAQAVYEWTELKKQIGDTPFHELLRVWLAAGKMPGELAAPSTPAPPPMPAAVDPVAPPAASSEPTV